MTVDLFSKVFDLSQSLYAQIAVHASFLILINVLNSFHELGCVLPVTLQLFALNDADILVSNYPRLSCVLERAERQLAYVAPRLSETQHCVYQLFFLCALVRFHDQLSGGVLQYQPKQCFLRLELVNLVVRRVTYRGLRTFIIVARHGKLQQYHIYILQYYIVCSCIRIRTFGVLHWNKLLQDYSITTFKTLKFCGLILCDFVLPSFILDSIDRSISVRAQIA